MLDQLMAYHLMREELERDHLGRWVIIHNSKLMGEDYNCCAASTASS